MEMREYLEDNWDQHLEWYDVQDLYHKNQKVGRKWVVYKWNKISPSQETIEAGVYMEVTIPPSLLCICLKVSKIKSFQKKTTKNTPVPC